MIQPTGQQIEALDYIKRWRGRTAKLVLQGWAGTGKTSLIPHIQELFNQDTVVVTSTNKAALVLRNKGVSEATTIHRFCQDLVDENTMTWAKKTTVSNRPALIIVDEASMVGERLRLDLESYGIPIIYIGDNFQLPPVKESCSVMDYPHIVLTEIHRQALDSPIIKVATAIREGRKYPDIDQYSLTDEEISSYDITLCLSNAKRFMLNDRIRKFRGYEGSPKVGETVIMAKTDYDLGIFNGERGVITLADGYRYRVLFDGQAEDMAMGPTKFLELGENPFSPENRGRRCLDMGYCCTVHKAQGSSYKSVLYWDERRADARHRYTGATRAEILLTMAGF